MSNKGVCGGHEIAPHRSPLQGHSRSGALVLPSEIHCLVALRLWAIPSNDWAGIVRPISGDMDLIWCSTPA